MSSFADPGDLEPTDVTEEEFQQVEEEEEDGVPRSALHESIKRKGINSYYYAHSKQNHAPDWDGREAPRLMSKQALEVGVGREPESIRSYAWSDENEKIKIYVTMEGADALGDEAITLEWNELSLILTVQFPDSKTHLFLIKRLYDEIDDASFRVKKDKIILNLKKKEGKTAAWFDLKKDF
ncbi:calcyclin binding [Nannochloropsis oceanica]